MQRLGKIYIITNDLNDKVYVGQTVKTLRERFNSHCCYSKTDRSENMYIKRAIHKYGRSHFKINLVEEVPEDLLNEREIYWIAFYDSYNNGYNLTKGGQSSNYSNMHRLENTIDVKEFEDYILKFKPLAREVASHFGICRCSVYNLIKRIGNPNLILNSYNPRKPRDIGNIDSAQLIRDYKNGMTIVQLVRKYKIRKHRISEFLNNLGMVFHNGIKKHDIEYNTSTSVHDSIRS